MNEKIDSVVAAQTASRILDEREIFGFDKENGIPLIYMRFRPISPRKAAVFPQSKNFDSGNQQKYRVIGSKFTNENSQDKSTFQRHLCKNAATADCELKPTVSSYNSGKTRNPPCYSASKLENHFFQRKGENLNSNRGGKVKATQTFSHVRHNVMTSLSNNVRSDAITIFQLSKSRPGTVNYDAELKSDALHQIRPTTSLLDATASLSLPLSALQFEKQRGKHDNAQETPPPVQKRELVTRCCHGKDRRTLHKHLNGYRSVSTEPFKTEIILNSKNSSILPLGKSPHMLKPFRNGVLSDAVKNNPLNQSKSSTPIQKPKMSEDVVWVDNKVMTPAKNGSATPVLKVFLTKRKAFLPSTTRPILSNLSKSARLQYFGTSVKSITDTISRMVAKQKDYSLHLPSVNKSTKVFLKNVET